MDQSKILEINAAFWNILNRKNIEESAIEIIKQFHNLKGQSGIFFTGHYPKKNQNSFKAATNLGEVTFSENEIERRSMNFGEKKRVGHFRFWKQGKNLICFHHFWASEIGTSTEDHGGQKVEEFCIFFNPKTLELEYVGVEEIVYGFSLGKFHYYKTYWLPLYGTGRKRSGSKIKFSL